MPSPEERRPEEQAPTPVVDAIQVNDEVPALQETNGVAIAPGADSVVAAAEEGSTEPQWYDNAAPTISDEPGLSTFGVEPPIGNPTPSQKRTSQSQTSVLMLRRMASTAIS